MAARPLLRLLEKMIEEKGGDAYILEQVASNVPVRVIVEEFINPKTGKPFNRGMLHYWKKLTPEREDGWLVAREISAHNLMEDAADDIAAAESSMLTPADVQLLKEKNGFRMYLAERYNRKDYGKVDPAAAQVNISMGEGFLAALRQYGNAHAIQAQPEQKQLPEPMEAEIVDDDPISDLL